MYSPPTELKLLEDINVVFTMNIIESNKEEECNRLLVREVLVVVCSVVDGCYWWKAKKRFDGLFGSQLSLRGLREVLSVR